MVPVNVVNYGNGPHMELEFQKPVSIRKLTWGKHEGIKVEETGSKF